MGNPLLVNTLSARFAGLQPICLRREATRRRRTCWTLIDRRTWPYRMRRIREMGWYFQLNVTRRRISLRGRDERQRGGIMILAHKQMKFRSPARDENVAFFSKNWRGSAFPCTIGSINVIQYSQRNIATYTIYFRSSANRVVALYYSQCKRKIIFPKY